MNGLYSGSPDKGDFVKERVERHYELRRMARWRREVIAVVRYVLYSNYIYIVLTITFVETVDGTARVGWG